MTSPTAETIIGLIRDLIRESDDSDVPSIGDTFLFSVLTDIDYDIRRAYKKGGGNAPVAIHKDTGFTLIGNTELTEDVTSATADFDVDDSSGAESSGAFAIWDDDMSDVGFYTANAANNLSGVTGIGFDHEDGDELQFLYELPSDFKDFYRTDEYPNGVQLDGKALFYSDSPPVPGKFTVRENNGTKYLWFYRDASGKASILYEKTTDTIDSLDDMVGFDEEWRPYYVWKGIERALFGRGDFNIVQMATIEAAKIKKSILESRNIRRRPMIRPLSMNVRRPEDYLSYSDTH
jgi:hypothetical protein